MRNQPHGSSPEKAPCCLYSGRISRRTGSRDSISQPSAKAWRNSDCETRRGPSIPGVASLKQSRNRRAGIEDVLEPAHVANAIGVGENVKQAGVNHVIEAFGPLMEL